MIAGPHDVLPVRQTATTSGNASRRLVRRISVASGLICLALGFASIAGRRTPKKDAGHPDHSRPPDHMSTMADSPMPQYEERRPAPAAKDAGKPASELPPLPAEPLAAQGEAGTTAASQTAAGRRIADHPGPSRSGRSERAALPSRSTAPFRIAARRMRWIPCIGRNSPCRCSSIDSRRAPIMMQPGSSGMGQQGPMSGPMSGPMDGPRLAGRRSASP